MPADGDRRAARIRRLVAGQRRQRQAQGPVTLAEALDELQRQWLRRQADNLNTNNTGENHDETL